MYLLLIFHQEETINKRKHKEIKKVHENKIAWRNFVPARQFIRQAEQSFVPGLNHSKFTCLMGGNFSVCARSAHVHIEEDQSRVERVKKLCAEVCVPRGLCQPGTLQQHCSLLP